MISARASRLVQRCDYAKPSIKIVGQSRADSGRADRFVELPKPERTSLSSIFAQGDGGRCSYSGDTCTIFGATGIVGTAFVNRIVKNGTQLIIPYRKDPYDYRHLKTAGELGQIYYMPYNLKDDQSIRKAIKYSNLVVNFIGSWFETRNFPYEEVHVNGPRRIARACRELGVQRLVHFSALNASTAPEEVFIPGGSRFLKSKALGEIAVREEFPSATIIRPADIYSHRDRFVNTFMSMWRRQVGYGIGLYAGGKGVYRAPVWLNDVVSGTVKALSEEWAAGETFELLGPYSYELSELVDWMYEICSRGWDIGYIRQAYGVLFQIKSLLNEMYTYVFKAMPRWNWESIECQETRSDTLTGCRTFQDLAIEPVAFEQGSRLPLELFDLAALWRVHRDEMVHPTPPARHAHRRVQVKKSVHVAPCPFLPQQATTSFQTDAQGAFSN